MMEPIVFIDSLDNISIVNLDVPSLSPPEMSLSSYTQGNSNVEALPCGYEECMNDLMSSFDVENMPHHQAHHHHMHHYINPNLPTNHYNLNSSAVHVYHAHQLQHHHLAPEERNGIIGIEMGNMEIDEHSSEGNFECFFDDEEDEDEDYGEEESELDENEYEREPLGPEGVIQVNGDVNLNDTNNKEMTEMSEVEYRRYGNRRVTSTIEKVRTWKKYAKKKHLTQTELDKKRDLANKQERRRMHRLNSALDRLRKKIGESSFVNLPNKRRLSKIKTLKLAIDHIRKLQNMLN